MKNTIVLLALIISLNKANIECTRSPYMDRDLSKNCYLASLDFDYRNPTIGAGPDLRGDSNFMCNGDRSCHGKRIICDPNKDCTVKCHGRKACLAVHVLCPTGKKCDIRLGGFAGHWNTVHGEPVPFWWVDDDNHQDVGYQMVINATHSSELAVHAVGDNKIFDSAVMHCPEDGMCYLGCKARCDGYCTVVFGGCNNYCRKTQDNRLRVCQRVDIHARKSKYLQINASAENNYQGRYDTAPQIYILNKVNVYGPDNGSTSVNLDVLHGFRDVVLMRDTTFHYKNGVEGLNINCNTNDQTSIDTINDDFSNQCVDSTKVYCWGSRSESSDLFATELTQVAHSTLVTATSNGRTSVCTERPTPSPTPSPTLSPTMSPTELYCDGAHYQNTKTSYFAANVCWQLRQTTQLQGGSRKLECDGNGSMYIVNYPNPNCTEPTQPRSNPGQEVQGVHVTCNSGRQCRSVLMRIHVYEEACDYNETRLVNARRTEHSEVAYVQDKCLTTEFGMSMKLHCDNAGVVTRTVWTNELCEGTHYGVPDHTHVTDDDGIFGCIRNETSTNWLYKRRWRAMRCI
eukprot:46469_1